MVQTMSLLVLCLAIASNRMEPGSIETLRAALQPNRDINGISSRRLFFAELHGDDVTACIVLEGTATVGCSLCSGVMHPTHGFHQVHQKPKDSFQPTIYSPTSSKPIAYLQTSYTLEQLKPYKDKL